MKKLKDEEVKEIIEKLKKLGKKIKTLKSEKDLDLLVPGDVIVLKNRGYLVYEGTIDNKMYFISADPFENNKIHRCKCEKERICVLPDSGYGMIQFHGREIYDRDYRPSDREEYEKRKKMLEEAGLI